MRFDEIFAFIMKRVHDRHHRRQKSERIADEPMARFRSRQQTSKRYKVIESGNGIYQTQDSKTGRKCVVNLKKRTWDCTVQYKL
jgi:hypothetical protein